MCPHRPARSVLLLTGAFLLAVPPSAAQTTDTGQALYAACSIAANPGMNPQTLSPGHAYAVGLCFGIIQAVSDTINVLHVQGMSPPLLCPPHRHSTGHPQRRPHLPT